MKMACFDRNPIVYPRIASHTLRQKARSNPSDLDAYIYVYKVGGVSLSRQNFQRLSSEKSPCHGSACIPPESIVLRVTCSAVTFKTQAEIDCNIWRAHFAERN